MEIDFIKIYQKNNQIVYVDAPGVARSNDIFYMCPGQASSFFAPFFPQSIMSFSSTSGLIISNTENSCCDGGVRRISNITAPTQAATYDFKVSTTLPDNTIQEKIYQIVVRSSLPTPTNIQITKYNCDQNTFITDYVDGVTYTWTLNDLDNNYVTETTTTTNQLTINDYFHGTVSVKLNSCNMVSESYNSGEVFLYND